MIYITDIHNRLVEAIEMSDLTGKEIGRRIGRRQQTVSKYVTGEAMPSLPVFAELCKVLDVSADYILGLKEFS